MTQMKRLERLVKSALVHPASCPSPHNQRICTSFQESLLKRATLCLLQRRVAVGLFSLDTFEQLSASRPILTFTEPCSISVAGGGRRRGHPFRVGRPRDSVSRHPGRRRKSGAIVGVAVIGGRHRRILCPPQGAAIPRVIRRRRRGRWGQGSAIVRVERRGHETVSSGSRRRGWRVRGAGGGHSIRARPIFLVIIDHAVPIPLAVVGTVGVHRPSRGRWWQGRGGVARGHRPNATPHETRWGGVRPIARVAGGPVATVVWGRRWVLFFSIVSGAALGNLDMDAFS